MWSRSVCLLQINKCRLNELNYSVTLQPFYRLFSRTTWVIRYQKGKTNMDFTGARDSEWQWHQLGHMQVCISLQTDNHASTPPLCFLQAGCPSCRPTNSVKALKAALQQHNYVTDYNSKITAIHVIACGQLNFSVTYIILKYKFIKLKPNCSINLSE